ncbi:IscS subfamily cysteine desulfurase [Candidatus Poribacteria bacterium]|nr:IscS subfamily cysteine desulfurase [Candidatus Poribacteria bacterium]
MELPIYFDHHATTPIAPSVLESMMPYLTKSFGNASSTTHAFGQQARLAVEQARKQIADLIGASPEEILFTSGATESDNLAIKGVADGYRRRGNHIITTQIEHSAILDTCKVLEGVGFEITYLPVDKYGMVDPQKVADGIRAETILISVIYASNEVGTINPLSAIGEIARQHGILFHSDAVQGIGKIESNVDRLNVDLMSLTAHKMYGPKGIGVLYVRQKRPRIRLSPQNYGGGQEGKIRSGTLNVPGIVGFGQACQLAQTEMQHEAERLTSLRDRLYQGLKNQIDLLHLNGHPAQRLPGNLNVSIEFVESLTLLEKLEKIALSTGSACSSNSMTPSRVLTAMGIDESLARAPIRFGLGRDNTVAEVDYVILRMIEEIAKLRRLSPLYQMRMVSG